MAERHVGVGDVVRLEARAPEKRPHCPCLLVDRLLNRAQFRPPVRETDRPGRKVGSDVAFRNAANRYRPVLRHLGPAKPVAECVPARCETNRKNRYRAQKDGTAVLQLLDHGFDTQAFVRVNEQPPVTIAGHGCDEPCIYSDESSTMK